MFEKNQNPTSRKGKTRIGESQRISSHSTRELTVVREGFTCHECGNDKAFNKHGMNQCTRCKNKQRKVK